MTGRFAGLLLAALLAGCTQLPEAPLPARDQLTDFLVDGRFALKVRQADGSTDSSGGRLSWTHRQESDRLLLLSPLGVGLAELVSADGRARLTTADGRAMEAADAEQLLAEATGQALPIGRLAGWLLGRPGPGGSLQRDALARPLHLDEGGWQVAYAYADENPEAPPSRLTAISEAIELRLRIETWKALP